MATVSFTVNDIQCTVGSEVSSSTSLLNYIRNTLELHGTKYMCLEGGCGACIVSVLRPDGCTHSVNSCLISVTSCDKWQITTIEGIGNKQQGYHILQKTLADNDGTQCGYCSPGWVMAMYGLLKTKKMTMLEIEKSLASNMCRCTGYRPILKAFKQFAIDAPPAAKLSIDIEDLATCKDKRCSRTSCDEYDWCFLPKTVDEDRIYIQLKDDKEWFKVQTTAEVFSILQAKGDDSYMLVAGNTGKGVIPIVDYPRILIDISEVSELKGYYFDQNLVIGAGSTLTELMNIFQYVSQTREDFSYLSVLNDHLKLVAHIPVRNLGTVAGNLMLKHQDPEFTSDVFLILETVGADITIVQSYGANKVMSLPQFLQEDMTSKIVYNVILPPLGLDNRVVTYKVMKRSQNAVAIVNAGFVYKIDPSYRVISARIVFSGLQPGYTRGYKSEAHLIGKNLFSNDTLQAAVQILVTEIVVTKTPVEGSVDYRRKLAIGLFYKGLLSLCPSNILKSRYRSGAIKLHESRGVSSGKQIYTTDSSLYPVNQPIHKVEGLIQCAGEAPYSDDVPKIPRQVYAAFVLSTVGIGEIEHIDDTKALAVKGVIAFYTAKDIPGANTFTSGASGNTNDEELLCDGKVKFFNQPIGIIVAEDDHIAQMASSLVCVTYRNTRKPVIDVKEAKHLKDKTYLVKIINGSNQGEDVVSVIRGNNTEYGQYHFCYENIVCVSWPTEDGIAARAATQSTDSDQITSSRCLNIDQNRIDVENRRSGGAFGLKITRSLQVSAACNLVTYKLNRPCRFILPLRTTMRSVGKRFSASIDYEVGVNKKGDIQYINYTVYSDNGYIVNERIVEHTYDVYFNCYKQHLFNFKAYDTITDKASNSFCRSPGSLEAISTTEFILERIAYELNLDPLEVRLANLDGKYRQVLTDMVDKLKKDADYLNRKSQVSHYNSENRWKKRGIRFAMMKWNSKPPYYSDVTVSVLHGDGTVVIAYGGAEIGQGINTKMIQVCAYFLNISVDKIKVKGSHTTITPNSAPTVGSATSQTAAIGVQRACEDLLVKIAPVRRDLDDPSWEDLVEAAYAREIDLQGHGFVNTSDVHNFDVYAVALAEVEVDILTGEWSIIRVDLLEDVGRSINPLIDIGQIEGAFIMGVGYFTMEDLIYDYSGELLTERTWTYKILQALDIPIDFRVYFKPKPYRSDIVLGSKAVGEPATVMGVVVPFAMREAIASARSDAGKPTTEWFEIDGPHTVEKICLTSCTDIKEFKYY
ncbi:unnamed protein product [Leptosia nina]|uniref:Uncharacterized protein n=1 Tax=Leptosia nina TaxID=320188 RepID=A0AAV1J0A7_9NEOP